MTEPAENTEPPKRGLAAVDQSRVKRNKLARPPLRAVGWFALIVLVAVVLRLRCDEAEIDGARQALMARQRVVDAELGPRWYPLRDRVEEWAVELADTPGQEIVRAAELEALGFRERPGLYLRARVDQAKTPEGVRQAAQESLRDGFTACMTRGGNPSILEGPECERTRDCAPGELCGELGRCSVPIQPFNLRTAYKSLYVLSPDWVEDVQEASNSLRVKLLAASFEDAVQDDLPVATELLMRAQYFMLVLDERPAQSRPQGQVPTPEEGEPDDTVEEAVGDHPSRVAIWRLSDGELLLRIRRTATARMVGGAPADAQTERARRRQANACALALAVREAMGDATVPRALPVLEEPPIDGAPVDEPPSPED